MRTVINSTYTSNCKSDPTRANNRPSPSSLNKYRSLQPVELKHRELEFHPPTLPPPKHVELPHDIPVWEAAPSVLTTRDGYVARARVVKNQLDDSACAFCTDNCYSTAFDGDGDRRCVRRGLAVADETC